MLLIDSWYACRAILNQATAYGWGCMVAIKSNRGEAPNGAGSSIPRGLGMHWRSGALYHPGRRQHEVWFLVSNDVQMDAEEAVRQCAARFGIETFHRDIKQYWGFGELWGRSWLGVQRHWTLCLLAYNTLQLWNATLPSHQRAATFGEIARSFRRSVSECSAVHWCASFSEAA
jgi:hypothetical protein